MKREFDLSRGFDSGTYGWSARKVCDQTGETMEELADRVLALIEPREIIAREASIMKFAIMDLVGVKELPSVNTKDGYDRVEGWVDEARPEYKELAETLLKTPLLDEWIDTRYP